MWKIAEKAGVTDSSDVLRAAVMHYEECLAAKREAEGAVRDAKADYDDALAVAVYDLAGQFVVEGNKTWLMDAAGLGKIRTMTADEKKDWIARHAATDQEVAALRSALRAATDNLDEAKDAVDVADRRISASKYAVQASVAIASLLEHALGY
jgi:hypothetical protein